MSVTTSMPKASSPGPLVDGLLGRVRDVDTHEMFPARLWVETYGAEFAPIAEFFLKSMPENVPNSVSVQRITDDAPITKTDLESYWGQACLAPSAFDMERRVEFMDVAGIVDSLVFGTTLSFFGQKLAIAGGASVERDFDNQLALDQGTMGRAMVRAHNDWCIRVARQSPRVRPVAVIFTHTLDEAMEESKRVIGEGVRAVQLPACQPIAGRAPSHPDNDPLWNLYAERNIPALLHVGSEPALLREHDAWHSAPQFARKDSHPTELQIDPYSLATLSLGAQNYVTNMVLGGVFERVPDLRFGVMELCGHWIGPLAEHMDVWAEQFAHRMGTLGKKPSEYVQRNIRATVFTFEPIDKYLERHPFLHDVFCFSSDYPHYEGGKNPIEVVANKLSRLGPDAVEKFFITNADWVMPN